MTNYKLNVTKKELIELVAMGWRAGMMDTSKKVHTKLVDIWLKGKRDD